MKRSYHVAPTTDEIVTRLVDEFIEWTGKAKHPQTLSLSGGSTPGLFFKALANTPAARDLPWQQLHLFWGDERCVPPDHADSNFGMTKRLLLDHIQIPDYNIHRIHGENDPASEIVRYASEIDSFVKKDETGFPQFDWIILGLGTDGHTASLFPGDSPVSESKDYCTMTIHPESGQKRISTTMSIINNAKRVSFLVTGSAKSQIVSAIFNQAMEFPASHVQPHSGIIEWFLDSDASALL